MHLTGGSSNNTFNPIAPTNNSSPNTCSSSIVNSKKQHSNSSTIKCDNSSFAQHVDSSKSISKNSLRLDITSKTCDALAPPAANAATAAAAASGGGGGGGGGVCGGIVVEERIDAMASPKCDATTMSPQTAQSTSSSSKKSVKRNFSMISFKSLDFNLRSICSSMKGKHGKDTNSSGSGKSTTVPTASSSKTSITTTTRAPYLRVEAVDKDTEEEHLLISFPQSPYSHRGSFDKTQSQHLTTVHSDYSRSQTSSPFLSITTPPNIRRSSTSDIIDKKPAMPSTNVTPNESRRPSTSSLLRRARERKGSETKGGKFSYILLIEHEYFRQQLRLI